MEGDAKAQPYSFTDFDADLKIAREMHRQEIDKAYYDGAIHSDYGKYMGMTKYYTETFQKPNNNQNG